VSVLHQCCSANVWSQYLANESALLHGTVWVWKAFQTVWDCGLWVSNFNGWMQKHVATSRNHHGVTYPTSGMKEAGGLPFLVHLCIFAYSPTGI
jgi:hypothetical protein